MIKWYVWLTYRDGLEPQLFEFATKAKAREFITTMPEALRPNIQEAELYSHDDTESRA